MTTLRNRHLLSGTGSHILLLQMKRGVNLYISGNISPLHDATWSQILPLHNAAGSQILPPYHAPESQFGTRESVKSKNFRRLPSPLRDNNVKDHKWGNATILLESCNITLPACNFFTPRFYSPLHHTAGSQALNAKNSKNMKQNF
jgi:hypothetical protein